MTTPGSGPVPDPEVSVVVIFCNEEEHLIEAVTSVFDQTFTNWELLLVDDGSYDGSSELARGFATQRPGQVHYLTHDRYQRRGMSASRNLGVRSARGRYIAYLDGDDRWQPEKLERQLELMAANPDAAVVYGPLILWRSWIDHHDRGDDSYGIHGDGFTLPTNTLYQPPDLVAHFIRHKDLVPSGALFRRQVFLDVGGAEEAFTDNYEDAVVFTKIGIRHPIYCANESWYLYRQYPGSVEREHRRRTRPDAERLRGDRARSVFLDWAEGYLRAEGVHDARLRSALRSARRQIEHSRRHRLHRIVVRGCRAPAHLVGKARSAGRLAGRHLGLLVRRRLFRIPMNLVTDEFGFSLAEQGWHPFIALLEDLARADGTGDRTTDYERFFRTPCVNAVRDLNDLLDLRHEPLGFADLPQFWLGTYPWGGLASDQIDRPGPAYGWALDEETGTSTSSLWGADRTPWYRPDDEATMANERRLTVELVDSIRRGYRPLKARGLPKLTILRRPTGDYRGVIVDGHHRMAVLAYLGYDRALVEIEAVVEERDVDHWYYVRNGRCSPDEALPFFEAFFELDGSERFDFVSGRWSD